MGKLNGIKPERVFKYFEEISAVPRGSGNMDAISSYCMDFAAAHSLKALRDDANNVIIFKDASAGYENSEPVILQGHLDMVCQKEEGCGIDFEKDGLTLYTEGDYVKAKGTTLGADNGIAVAMIMAILEDDSISHPPIEAVFTTDEEIGLIGASKLCADNLKGKRLINLDAEDPGTITVSCAGGSDFRMTIPVKRRKMHGGKVTMSLKGLKGGHSGVEINSGRVNANILAGRVLNYAKSVAEFEIIAIDGGDKGNAIPLASTIQLVTNDAELLAGKLEEYFNIIKEEIADREPDFAPSVNICEEGEFDVIVSPERDKLIFMLLCAPNGVTEMSVKIENLVETSLNLGIFKTEEDKITVLFALRSNKKSALKFLEDKLYTFASCIECSIEASGHYPPWEFKENSVMQKLCKEAHVEQLGYEPEVVAIHAGLECGIFCDKINGIDCIAIGPEIPDVHTVNERLSISSTNDTFGLILKILEKCK